VRRAQVKARDLTVGARVFAYRINAGRPVRVQPWTRAGHATVTLVTAIGDGWVRITFDDAAPISLPPFAVIIL
jgi:hypothetical protein